MDDEEAAQAYDRLINTLQEKNLGWVVEQVREEVRLGRAQAKSADTSEFVDDESSVQKRGRRQMVEFITTVPYSAAEKLSLLLDAIDRILFLPDFETAAIKNLHASSVRFLPSEDESGDESALEFRSAHMRMERESARLAIKSIRELIV